MAGEYLATKKILVAGSSGLIGTALVASLQGDGHEVWMKEGKAMEPATLKEEKGMVAVLWRPA